MAKDPDEAATTGKGFAHSFASLSEALLTLAKLVLVAAIAIAVLWHWTAVKNRTIAWLNGATHLGFLGVSVDRDAAERDIDEIAARASRGQTDYSINADFARGVNLSIAIEGQNPLFWSRYSMGWRPKLLPEIAKQLPLRSYW